MCWLYHILYKMYRVQNNVWGFIKNKRVDSLNQNLTLKLKIYLMLETTADIYTCHVGR